MKNLAKLGVDMINVHAAGTIPMMRAAIEGLNEGTVAGAKRPLCIAVTQLTSTTEEVMQEQTLINTNPVLKYAQLTKEAGLDGIVCSALETKEIHEKLGAEFITCTPGIRQASDSLDDQKRVVTPKKAKELCSNYIVVGRSITKSAHPVNTYHQIKNEFLGTTCE